MTGIGFIIAVDGTAASGKGTLSKALAESFNFDYLDTGLLYRIAAYHVILNEVDINNINSIINCIEKISFDEIKNINFHTDIISVTASQIASIPEIRSILNELQKNFQSVAAELLLMEEISVQ